MITRFEGIIFRDLSKARLLILRHGSFIYNVMGLTLSRAIALLQTR